MPRSPQLYEPDVVYEITTRTIQGRYLLRPSREANEIIAGVIGRAQQLYPDVEVYGVVALSNHLTWLVASALPWLIPEFMGFINGRISRELGRRELHDWPGPMWGRAARTIPICDNEALVARFKYLLAQGCKEHLVKSPLDWPGVSCVPTLVTGQRLEGVWFWRDDRYKAKRSGKRVTRYAMTERYEVKFAKLPCWRHLSDSDYQAHVAKLVQRIESEARHEREVTGKRVLGAAAILSASPHTRPDDLERTPAPLCHASTSEIRASYEVRYRSFADAFRAAATRLKEALPKEGFPLWCFPPRLPFVCSTA